MMNKVVADFWKQFLFIAVFCIHLPTNCYYMICAGKDLFEKYLDQEGCSAQLNFIWACEGLKATGKVLKRFSQ